MKRVEATTGCRVFIRGKGSIKDPDKVKDMLTIFLLFFSEFYSSFCFDMFCRQEEKLKGKPGYEHLNEQLHILIEADLPADIVDIKLRHAQEIIEELVKPVVCAFNLLLLT